MNPKASFLAVSLYAASLIAKTESAFMDDPSASAFWPLLRIVVALLVVLGLLYLLLHRGLGSWLQRSQASRVIQIKERCALDARKSLYVVQLGDRRFLIGGSDQGLNLISELSSDTQPTTERSNGS